MATQTTTYPTAATTRVSCLFRNCWRRQRLVVLGKLKPTSVRHVPSSFNPDINLFCFLLFDPAGPTAKEDGRSRGGKQQVYIPLSALVQLKKSRQMQSNQTSKNCSGQESLCVIGSFNIVSLSPLFYSRHGRQVRWPTHWIRRNSFLIFPIPINIKSFVWFVTIVDKRTDWIKKAIWAGRLIFSCWSVLKSQRKSSWTGLRPLNKLVIKRFLALAKELSIRRKRTISTSKWRRSNLHVQPNVPQVFFSGFLTSFIFFFEKRGHQWIETIH